MTQEHVIAYSFFKALKDEGVEAFWREWDKINNRLIPDYREIHWPEE